jgi:hypothetical protein
MRGWAGYLYVVKIGVGITSVAFGGGRVKSYSCFWNFDRLTNHLALNDVDITRTQIYVM